MFEGINPFADIGKPTHFLNEQNYNKEEINKIHLKLQEALKEKDDKIHLTHSTHAVLNLLTDVLRTWRMAKIKDTTDMELNAQAQETFGDAVIYCQYAQVLTKLLWSLPIDLSKDILKACMIAQEMREKYYFGDKENEQTKR